MCCGKARGVSELRSDELIVKPFGLGGCALFRSEARRASLSIPPGAARREKGSPKRAILLLIPKPAGLHFLILRAQLGDRRNALASYPVLFSEARRASTFKSSERSSDYIYKYLRKSHIIFVYKTQAKINFHASPHKAFVHLIKETHSVCCFRFAQPGFPCAE